MANIQGQKKWSEVRLLETHELARGGVNGNLNEQAKALADRTEFLNQEKASKSEIVQGVFEFGTFAEFNAAKTSLPANCTVVIGEENKTGTGTWGIGNNRWNGIDLKKSSFDPVIQANEYTNQKTEKVIRGLSGKNIFNPTAPDIAIGYFPVHTTGNLQANASYNTTGFIPVVSNLQYSVHYKHYWAWYDANKVFISGTSDANTEKTQTAPVNAVYMRASCPVGVWNVFQVEQSTAPTSYEAYTQEIFLDPNRVRTNSLPSTVLTDNSLAIEKVSFKKTGKNIFNKNAVTNGFYIGANGQQGQSVNHAVSEFIAVQPSTQYMAASGNSGARFICFYDENKLFVSGGLDDSAFTTKTFTTTAQTKFIRVSVRVQDLAGFQVEIGSVSTVFEDYCYKLVVASNIPIIASILNNQVETDHIKDYAITPSKVNFIKTTKNLFNKATATIGVFIDPTNGNTTANTGYDTSALIPVQPSTQYWGQGLNGMRFVAFYNASGILITGGVNDTNKLKTFTTPSDVYFVRVSIDHADLAIFQLEKGSARTEFQSFGYYLETSDGLPIISGGVTATPSISTWAGKSWATLGDSITAGQTWQGFVVNKYGLVWTNYGIGGTKISGSSVDANAMCQDTRINAIPTTVDLVTLMGGTNDWAQNVPLGDINSTDPLTFNGALNTFAQKAFKRWPTKRIALATTPYGEIPAFESRPGWTSPAKNSLGLTTNDYAEAIRQFCKRANLHCIDVALSAGWGALNITEALGGSTTDHLHPTSGSNAAKGIGIVHIKALKDIEPLQ